MLQAGSDPTGGNSRLEPFDSPGGVDDDVFHSALFARCRPTYLIGMSDLGIGLSPP